MAAARRGLRLPPLQGPSPQGREQKRGVFDFVGVQRPFQCVDPAACNLFEQMPKWYVAYFAASLFSYLHIQLSHGYTLVSFHGNLCFFRLGYTLVSFHESTSTVA